MIEDSKRPEPRFKGMAHGVKTIVREEGYRGVYRGLGPVVRFCRGIGVNVDVGQSRLTRRCCGKEPILPCDSRHTRH